MRRAIFYETSMVPKMQRKLFQWDLPLKHLETLIPHHHHQPFSFHSLQSVKQGTSSLGKEELDDPPFSLVPNTPPTSTTGTDNGHCNKKKNRLQYTAEPNKSNPSKTLDSMEPPLHSDLPFDFQYSYSETNPLIKLISFREPKFSPFGPGRLDRKWNGWLAPVKPGLPSFEGSSRNEWESGGVLGEPLTELEVESLVEKYGHNNCSRQINLGRSGVTHNMLDDIHNHWKRAEAIRIKCLGVPTLDMDNVCFHLEDKTGGKVISRRTNILLLYRGRHYDPKKRPIIPLMLWKPHAPIYPRLVKNVAEGLTLEETKEMRNKGLNSPALVKLTQNGVYVSVVEKVREAFKVVEVLRIDCTFVETNDCKKIAVKLRDLVPCIPLLIKSNQIIIWSGKKEKTLEEQQSMENISQIGQPSPEISPCSSKDAAQ